MYLRELADLLDGEGLKANLYIISGAAMVLGFSARDMTPIVDASIIPKLRSTELRLNWLKNTIFRMIG